MDRTFKRKGGSSSSSSTVRLPRVLSFSTPTSNVPGRNVDRFVDCSPLKRALEGFYGTLLAKGTHPFVYLSLSIHPTKIDVNVHPTKKEVGFEDQDEIVELICLSLAKALEEQGESRSYKVQVSRSVNYSAKALFTNSSCRPSCPVQAPLDLPLLRRIAPLPPLRTRTQRPRPLRNLSSRPPPPLQLAKLQRRHLKNSFEPMRIPKLSIQCFPFSVRVLLQPSPRRPARAKVNNDIPRFSTKEERRLRKKRRDNLLERRFDQIMRIRDLRKR